MRGGEDQVGARGVVDGVVHEGGVVAVAEVERLHVADLEGRVHALGGGDFAGDLDHLRCDVVAGRLEAVARGEAGHPAGAAPQLDEAHPRAQVEKLDDVAEVDEQACGLARLVGEGLRLQPALPLLADRDRVVDLRLLPLFVEHAVMLRSAGKESVLVA